MNDIHERFDIQLPADAVFAALSEPERILRALPGVTSVYRFPDGSYRLETGAGGRPAESHFEITERTPPRHVAWRSRDGRWSGSADVESLGTSRSLVIIEARDTQGTDPVAIDAAMRALKQALEAAASNQAPPAGQGDDIHVKQRSASERAESAADDGGSRHEANADEDSWRGSRGFFPGGGEARAMVRSLTREVDRLWEQVMRRAATAGRTAADMAGAWTPAIDMGEREGDLLICVEVPGVEPDALRVDIDPELLVVRGERRSRYPERASPRMERRYGTFVRRIPLPAGLDAGEARARLRHGVLEVTIPVTRLHRGREVPVESDEPQRAV